MVIKPGTAPWIEPGPGRSGTWTGSGLLKDRLVRPMTRANPDETRFFFPFSNVVSVLHPPFLFHHLLYNELLLAAVERKGEWGTLSLEVGRRRGWSGWSPVSVGGGSGLAKRWRRVGKKKEGLSSFGQKTRGMTERGMREVVAGVFIPCCLTECLLEREWRNKGRECLLSSNFL
jgi:hypothetical protein